MMKRLTAAAVAATIAFFSVSSTAQADPYLQCVALARMVSGIQIFGDAWTWWSKAVGKYETGKTPETGAVLVFKPSGRMHLGHVAVVSQVLTDRIIQVTHANWSPYNGSRGKVEHDVTMVDVSAKGDWSQVKVWYNPIGDLGTSVYPTYGFIYQAAKTTQGVVKAAAKDHAAAKANS